VSAVRGLSELVLVVRDAARSATFYEDAVGLRVETPAGSGWAWFRLCDDPVQRFAVAEGPLLFEDRSPRAEAFGGVHFALRVERGDLEAALARLDQHGVEVLGPTRFDWMGAESRYFYDPDGHLVEFWTPD